MVSGWPFQMAGGKSWISRLKRKKCGVVALIGTTGSRYSKRLVRL